MAKKKVVKQTKTVATEFIKRIDAQLTPAALRAVRKLKKAYDAGTVK